MPTRPAPARRPRNLKTPKQRAAAVLEVVQRQAESLDGKVRDARAELDRLEGLHRAAVRRLRHAEANPDLHDEDDTELPFDEHTEKP